MKFCFILSLSFLSSSLQSIFHSSAHKFYILFLLSFINLSLCFCSHSFIYPFIHSCISSFIYHSSFVHLSTHLSIYSLIYPFFLPYFLFKVKETSVSYPKSSVAVMPIFHATTTTPKHEHVNSLSTVDVKETPTTFYHWKLATKHAKAIPKV